MPLERPRQFTLPVSVPLLVEYQTVKRPNFTCLMRRANGCGVADARENPRQLLKRLGCGLPALRARSGSADALAKYGELPYKLCEENDHAVRA